MLPPRWWALAAVLLVPTGLRAQEPRLAGRLSDAARVEVEAVLDTARQRGLPTEPLVDRALEGASKRADEARILAAVRRLAVDLEAAQRALGPGTQDAEITAGAAALRAGGRPADLQRLRAQRVGRSVTVAAAVLADLVALGVPPDTATAAVLALADGTEDAAYLAFRQSIERDVALGATPLAALTARLAQETLADAPTAARPRKP